MRLLYRLKRIAAIETARPATNYKISCRLLLMAVTMLGISSYAFAGTYAVGTCTGFATYPTISQAVSSVPAGSIIEVCPGNYAEQVLITKRLSVGHEFEYGDS